MFLCSMHDEGSTFDDENGWSIEPLATVAFPDTPELGAMIENEAIEWFRRTYEPHLILNTSLIRLLQLNKIASKALHRLISHLSTWHIATSPMKL